MSLSSLWIRPTLTAAMVVGMLFPNLLHAQLPNNQLPGEAALSGRYYVRHVLFNTTTAGTLQEARTFFGIVTFNGAGSYTGTGTQLIGAGAPANLSVTGTYSVSSAGLVVLSNPQNSGVTMSAGLGQGGLVGSTTGVAGVCDMLVAVPLAASYSTTSLSGTFYGSALEIAGGAASAAKGASFRMVATGTGSLGTVTVQGKTAGQQNQTGAQNVVSATYSINGDGTGQMVYPVGSGQTAATQYVSGSKTIGISADGNIVVGGGALAGGHEMLVATKGVAGLANNGSLRDLFFQAGLRLDGGRAGCFSGSANANGQGRLVRSHGVRQAEGALQLTAVSNYMLSTDGTGTMDANRMALAAGGGGFHVAGLSAVDPANYEISFGVRAVAPSGTGTFIAPQGVVNAASFAPVGAPLSPGAFFSIFGVGLANATSTASALPFPTSLGGVQVLVNNVAAPVYTVSEGQISAMVPFGATGGSLSIVLVNNGTRSNVVTVPLSKTSPGIFTDPSAGYGPSAVLSANFEQITTSRPARRGEVVQLFLTGLGSVTPPVRDGAPGPSGPLSIVDADVKVYVGGRQARVLYKGLAPGLAGLYQLNFEVPQGAPTGSGVALAIETPDAFHDMADLPVSN